MPPLRAERGAERTGAGRAIAPRRWLLVPLAVGVITLLVFAPAVENGFVDLDDMRLITENQAFRGLSAPHLKWMLGATVMGHWQPLTWLSYAIDYTIAGLDPAQYHLTSILLHALNSALLTVLIARLMIVARPAADRARVWLAAGLGALLWAVHPLRVESAAWVTERRDVLSGCFLLLTALAYLRAFPPGGKGLGSAGWYAASILLLALSLLSKAWGMTFFVVAIVLDWYPLRRLPASPVHWLRRESWPTLALKSPYVVLGLASAWMASWAIHSIGAMRTLDDWPLRSRIPQAFYGLVFYGWKTLWPTRLCALYELRHGLDPFAPTYLACYAIVAVAAAGVLVGYRRFPALAAAVAVYAVSVAPVLGLFQSGDQFVADRYSYIACMAWSGLGAGGLLLLSERLRGGARIWPAAGAGIVAIALALASREQVATWHDSVTLWRQAWQSDPTRMVPHVNYGLNIEGRARALERDGKAEEARALDDEALEHYRIATRLKPDDGRGWYPMGNVLRRRGELAEAERAYRKAARTLPQAYMPLVQLGTMLLTQLNRPDEAIQAYRDAVDAVEHPRPGSQPSGLPYLALGTGLKKRGDLAGARDAFQRALAYADAPGGDAAEKAQVRDEAQRQLGALPRK
jgi:cytochrome c-type biogenesis protein CcmH/NrfG